MKLFSFLLFVILLLPDPNKVSKINKIKDEAKKAYFANDMKTAIAKYRYLIDSLHVNEEEVNMNLANAYFSQNDTTNAVNTYQPLTASANPKIKTLANQQMGVVANRQGKFEEALNYFKQAMKAEPDNEQARYNYEMVKKKLEEQKKQQQNKDQNNKDNKDNKDKKDQQNKDNKDQQNKDNKDQKDKQNQDKKDEQKDKQDQQKKDQQNKDEKNKEQKDKEQKDKEQKEKEQQNKDNKDKKDDQKKDEQKPDPSVQQKLQDMKMSEDKAKMILEAMKNQEAQYLQQNKRKASKPQNKNKPDW